MQPKSTLSYLIALTILVTITSGLTAHDNSKPKLIPGSQGQNRGVNSLHVTIPNSGRSVSSPTPVRSDDERLNDGLIAEAASHKPFDDATQLVISVFQPAVVGGLGAALTQVAEINGASTTKALTGGVLGVNAATVILHCLNARQNCKPSQDNVYQCLPIFGNCLVVEPKRLVTELVITNAIFITPKVWKAARSYFWPTKK